MGFGGYDADLLDVVVGDAGDGDVEGLEVEAGAGLGQAAELLLDFGRPDVSAVDNEGRTPLDIAMRSNNESLVKFLLKHV